MRVGDRDEAKIALGEPLLEGAHRIGVVRRSSRDGFSEHLGQALAQIVGEGWHALILESPHDS